MNCQGSVPPAAAPHGFGDFRAWEDLPHIGNPYTLIILHRLRFSCKNCKFFIFSFLASPNGRRARRFCSTVLIPSFFAYSGGISRRICPSIRRASHFLFLTACCAFFSIKKAPPGNEIPRGSQESSVISRPGPAHPPKIRPPAPGFFPGRRSRCRSCSCPAAGGTCVGTPRR